MKTETQGSVRIGSEFASLEVFGKLVVVLVAAGLVLFLMMKVVGYAPFHSIERSFMTTPNTESVTPEGTTNFGTPPPPPQQ
ncbi:MAG TPA: hypothetical protein PL182_01340 [Pseudobdellovibrionaceae bacterium]|nr:hypothetical protein [Pseudobdellovibrionaceae bacterium]